MRARDFLPKKDPSEKIESRLFDIALFITILFFLFWSVYCLFVDYTLTIKLIYWGGLMVYLAFYIVFKIKKFFFRAVAPLYYSSLLVLVTLSWFPAGGLDGPILYWFLLIYISGLLVLHIKIFRIFLPVSILIILLLSFLELSNPELAAPYSSTTLRIQDLAVAGAVCLIILGIAILVFKRAYIADREKLKVTNSELGNQKIKAEAADKAKTQFLATISHEMRTPLNGIVGITELLERTDLNSEQTELLQNLKASSRQLHSIISDVLDLSLVENNKLTLRENPFSIRDEVQAVIKVISPRLESKNGKVSLKYQHDTKIPSVVVGDADRFRQVLINLINNSVKFTHEGAIEVESRMVEEFYDLVRIHFSIHDTGIGIPPEIQSNIFSKFFKANEGSPTEGTGLGLSISRNLIEAMQGSIGFVSQPNKGTTFYFDVPFALPSDQVVKPVEDLSGCKLDYLKVLLAEDAAINQLVAKKMLKSIGVVDIDVAANGRLAVEKTRERDYDVILMDLQMPEMSGLEATRVILKEKREKPPIIIPLTANVMDLDIEACKEAGMIDFISKPFQADTLRAVLCRATKGLDT